MHVCMYVCMLMHACINVCMYVCMRMCVYMVTTYIVIMIYMYTVRIFDSWMLYACMHVIWLLLPGFFKRSLATALSDYKRK